MKNYYQDNDTKIYNCDNMALLTSLPDDHINLVYCDILYNTGKVFSDYNDNLGSPKEAVKWYRPRIEEMKRVLTRDGSIFIHCNWRMDSYMRILMDEVFGEANFHNRIYRKHSEERGFYKNFDSQMDIILYYLKDPANFTFNQQRNDKPQIVPLFEDGLIEQRNTVMQGIDLRAQNKHWLVSQPQLEKMRADGELRIIDGLPYRFSTVQPIGNLWDSEQMFDTYNRNTPSGAYDTPKPEACLERIIKTCSNPNDRVADFFMGGGTTAVVAKKLGRQFIGCDINEKSCEVTTQKLKSVTFGCDLNKPYHFEK